MMEIVHKNITTVLWIYSLSSRKLKEIRSMIRRDQGEEKAFQVKLLEMKNPTKLWNKLDGIKSRLDIAGSKKDLGTQRHSTRNHAKWNIDRKKNNTREKKEEQHHLWAAEHMK